MLPYTGEFFGKAQRHVDSTYSLKLHCKDCEAVDRYKRTKLPQLEAAGRAPSLCEACGVRLTPGKGKDAAAWDHNHATGEFRGWLCSNCNRALGFCGDNPRVMRALAQYLEDRGYALKKTLIR